ncbi:MAG: LysR family transcriptional regulator [Alphaproteobacteria bacterium]|nr:LysR family transcriptional regulator [Alphaproteobacteria bacterium]
MIRNIDIDLLRAFLTIYEGGSFSHAAEKLGRTQSTISQQIKKLEEILGKDVFIRTNRSVSLTTEGEVLLSYARQMIAINDEIIGRISKPDISGTVRLGAPEAFTTNHLPEVLIQFSKSHPSVALEVECGLSHHLVDKFEKGNFDLILIKRDNKTKIYGNKIWCETLVWAGLEKQKFKMDDTVPLILSPVPCVYRSKVVEALDKKKMRWKAVFTSASMAGRIAAARAGLGITVIPKEMLSYTHGLISLGQDCGLPAISAIEIELIQNEQNASDAAQRLADHIIFALENDPSLKKAS